MIYEVGISYISVDEKGNDKNTKGMFLLENINTFTEAEARITDEYGALANFDVYAIKRSRIKEIANARTSENEKIFLAEVADVYLEEDGSEKDIKYIIALFALTIEAAHDFIREYMKQGYSMELRSLKETRIADLLK